MRLAQISDLHLGASAGATIMGVDPRAQLERVLADVARFRPDFLLATGDLAHDGRTASYRHLRAALAALPCPAYTIAGNHDDPVRMRETLGPQPLTVRRGAWRLVLLTTQVPRAEHGAVRPAELAAATRQIRAHRGPVLVALHHPPAAVGSPWLDAMGLVGAEAFRRWVSDHRAVRLVVAGHVHQTAYRRIGAATLLTAPATSAQFAPRTTALRIDDRRPAWRALWLHADGTVRTRVRRLIAGAAGTGPARA